MLQAKIDYYKLVDLGMSIQEARYILPQSLSTFIIVNANLAALAPWIRKRMCEQTQCWEMIVVAREIRNQILATWPELEPTMPDDCVAGKCFWAQSIRKGDKDAHTNLYHEAGAHGDPAFGEIPSVYELSHEEMVEGPIFPSIYYIGDKRVDPWD
jgi:hypothetical protein